MVPRTFEKVCLDRIDRGPVGLRARRLHQHSERISESARTSKVSNFLQIVHVSLAIQKAPINRRNVSRFLWFWGRKESGGTARTVRFCAGITLCTLTERLPPLVNAGAVTVQVARSSSQ